MENVDLRLVTFDKDGKTYLRYSYDEFDKKKKVCLGTQNGLVSEIANNQTLSFQVAKVKVTVEFLP